MSNECPMCGCNEKSGVERERLLLTLKPLAKLKQSLSDAFPDDFVIDILGKSGVVTAGQIRMAARLVEELK